MRRRRGWAAKLKLRCLPLNPPRSPPKLLVLDTAYSLDLIRDRRLESLYVTRDLGGFFEHVYTVHPLVGASPEHVSRPGPPEASPLAPHHTMIEGKVGRFRSLRRLPVLDLLIAQGGLLIYLYRLVRREGVTLISANDPEYTGLFGLILARLTRLPLVVTVVANHDIAYAEQGLLAYPRLFRRRSVEKRVERIVFSSADLVAVGSEDNRGFAAANGARPERTIFFRYGDLVHDAHWIDPSTRPSVRSELGLGDRPFLITVARFEAAKHVADTISVLLEARRRIPSLAAVLVGDGALRPELEELTRRLGLQDDIVFAGVRDQGWIANAMASADVVISAITGRALVEASLSGTPIVAYDVEWQSEFVLSGETGLVVPYRDIARMAEAASRLIEDPALATSLAGRARARTAELLDPEANRSDRRRALAQLLGVPAEPARS